MGSLTGYEMSRRWFDFAFENPEKINPNHAAIYFFAVEHNNRLGWRNKFGYPSQMVMDAIGIKKHSTYIRYFNDLVEWGFFKLIQKSQNQYSSNIISLNNALPKNGRALDKAIVNHRDKQTETMWQSKRSIDKPITNKPITSKQVPTFEEFKKHSDSKKLDVNQTKLKLKYDSWVENNWHDGNGKPVKNWKSKLTATLPFLLNDKSTKDKSDYMTRVW